MVLHRDLVLRVSTNVKCCTHTAPLCQSYSASGTLQAAALCINFAIPLTIPARPLLLDRRE